MAGRPVRLIQIMELFRGGGSYTTKELADRLGVTVRTIQRDVLELQGEPIYLPLYKEEERYHMMESRPQPTMVSVLARGLGLGPLPIPPTPLPHGKWCAISGQFITEGYPVAAVVPKAAGEWLDMLSGQPTGWLCDDAARLFYGTNTWNLGSRLIFADGTAYHPLIAPSPGRPYWSQLVREVWPQRMGQLCVAILTTDVKKRLWPMARLGTLGAATPAVIYDTEQNICSCVPINWPVMLEILSIVEEVYSAGYSKRAIRESLYSEFGHLQEVGYQQTREWEKALGEYRDTMEFVMAVCIAQKKEEER